MCTFQMKTMCSFPDNVLPTKSDVVKRVQLSKDHPEFSTGKKKIKDTGVNLQMSWGKYIRSKKNDQGH